MIIYILYIYIYYYIYIVYTYVCECIICIILHLNEYIKLREQFVQVRHHMDLESRKQKKWAVGPACPLSVKKKHGELLGT